MNEVQSSRFPAIIAAIIPYATLLSRKIPRTQEDAAAVVSILILVLLQPELN